MEQLTSRHRADVAAMRDLDALERRMTVRIGRIEHDLWLEQCRRELRSFRVRLMAVMVVYFAILTAASVVAIKI